MIQSPTTRLALGATVILFLAAVSFLTVSADRPQSASRANGTGEIPQHLPQIIRGPQAETSDAANGLVTLSFDDGTCETGLAILGAVTTLVDFDLPAQCTQPGFSIVRLTARMNTGIGIGFTLRQAGTTPGVTRSGTHRPLSPPLQGLGDCPATGFSTRDVAPPAVVTGAFPGNFFAGVNFGTGGGEIGIDTSSPPAMRQWLNCPNCAMSTYGPTTLSGIGFPGNFLIRVTGEDKNCIPVELLEFTVRPE